MNIDFETLETIADEVGGEVRTNYSGRGMYGKTCVGIVLDDSNLLALGVAIADNIVRDYELRERLTSNYSTDSMGYNTIVYWIGVTCEDAPDEDDDEE